MSKNKKLNKPYLVLFGLLLVVSVLSSFKSKLFAHPKTVQMVQVDPRILEENKDEGFSSETKVIKNIIYRVYKALTLQ